MKIPAVAFKAKGKEGRYLCDGPDCADWSDKELDTAHLDDAFLIIRMDLTKPDAEDVRDGEAILFRYTKITEELLREHYESSEVELSPDQLAEVRGRNEW